MRVHLQLYAFSTHKLRCWEVSGDKWVCLKVRCDSEWYCHGREQGVRFGRCWLEKQVRDEPFQTLDIFLIYLKCNENSLRFYAWNKRQLCPKSLKGTLSGLWFCSLDQELWKWVSVRKKTIILALDTLTRVWCDLLLPRPVVCLTETREKKFIYLGLMVSQSLVCGFWAEHYGGDTLTCHFGRWEAEEDHREKGQGKTDTYFLHQGPTSYLSSALNNTIISWAHQGISHSWDQRSYHLNVFRNTLTDTDASFI